MEEPYAEDIIFARLNSLANSSIEIQKSRNESEVIVAVLTGLGESGFGEAILSLFEPDSGKVIGHMSSGSQGEQVLDMTDRHLRQDDVLAIALRTNQPQLISDSRIDARCRPDLVRKRDIQLQYVLPLRVGDEMIGTLQVDLGERNGLQQDEALLLQALSMHTAIAISHLRSQAKASQFMTQVMSSSHFIVAQTLFGMVVHSFGHRLKQVLAEINILLNRSDIRSNRSLYEVVRSLKSDFLTVDQDFRMVQGSMGQDSGLEITQVHTELKHSVDQWMPLLLQKKCSTRFVLSAAVTQCRIRPLALREIVSVLLVNAVQASAKTLTFSSMNSSKVESPSGNYIPFALCLDVTDDGAGLTDDDVSQLFQPAYTTSVGNRALGFNLFIGRALARQAGGELDLVERGKGSTGVIFRLTLPTLEQNA
jgi:signal transduction histidine kinase